MHGRCARPDGVATQRPARQIRVPMVDTVPRAWEAASSRRPGVRMACDQSRSREREIVDAHFAAAVRHDHASARDRAHAQVASVKPRPYRPPGIWRVRGVVRKADRRSGPPSGPTRCQISHWKLEPAWTEPHGDVHRSSGLHPHSSCQHPARGRTHGRRRHPRRPSARDPSSPAQPHTANGFAYPAACAVDVSTAHRSQRRALDEPRPAVRLHLGPRRFSAPTCVQARFPRGGARRCSSSSQV